MDQLRALAAGLVLLYHGVHILGYALRFGLPFSTERWLTTENPLLALVLEGHTAVALFMVLSGFILSYGTLGRGGLHYGRFVLNRVLRIHPLVVLFLVAGVLIHPGRTSLDGVLSTLLMLGPLAGEVDLAPFTSMFWAVAVEFQLYLLFPLLIRWLNEKGPRHLLGLLALVIAMRVVGMLLGASPRDLGYWTLLGRADQFLAGMLAAYVVVRHPQVTRWPLALGAAVAVLTGAAALNLAGGWPVDAWWRAVTPTAEAVVWVVFLLGWLEVGRWLPRALSGALCWLGERSFSVYLWHFVVIDLVVKQGWVPRLTGHAVPDALLGTVLLVFPVTLGLSLLTYHFVERPFLELRRRYVLEAPQEAAPARAA